MGLRSVWLQGVMGFVLFFLTDGSYCAQRVFMSTLEGFVVFMSTNACSKIKPSEGIEDKKINNVTVKNAHVKIIVIFLLWIGKTEERLGFWRSRDASQCSSLHPPPLSIVVAIFTLSLHDPGDVDVFLFLSTQVPKFKKNDPVFRLPRQRGIRGSAKI